MNPWRERSGILPISEAVGIVLWITTTHGNKRVGVEKEESDEDMGFGLFD